MKRKITILHKQRSSKESALSSSKIYKYKYVTGEDILPQIKVDEECSEILNLSDN